MKMSLQNILKICKLRFSFSTYLLLNGSDEQLRHGRSHPCERPVLVPAGVVSLAISTVFLCFGYFLVDKWASTREKLTSLYANNNGTDQPVHPRSLIKAFVDRFLESITCMAPSFCSYM